LLEYTRTSRTDGGSTTAQAALWTASCGKIVAPACPWVGCRKWRYGLLKTEGGYQQHDWQ